MIPTVATSLPSVSLSSIQKRVAETKSASTARYYSAMLNRLGEYNKSDVLDLNSVDPSFVSGFGSYLVAEGVTLSTVKLFKMAFRAVMKDVYGPQLKSEFRTAFKDVDSKNQAPTNTISLEDIHRLRDHNLDEVTYLKKVRLLFLYSLISGGIDLNEIRHLSAASPLSRIIPQQDYLLRKFESDNNMTMENFLTEITDEKYSQALSHISALIGLSNPLRSQSVVEGWVVSAVKAHISYDTIISIIPADSPFCENQSSRRQLTQGERRRALRVAANEVIDLKTRWYVMKCYEDEPEEVEKTLNNFPAATDEPGFGTFIPPKPKVPSGQHRDRSEREKKSSSKKTATKKPILGDMLFFKCTSSSARSIKKAMKGQGWVYTCSGTSDPAPISDTEMMTFMLLCDIAEDTLSCHFPESENRREEITVGRQATITNGIFSGQVGIITSLPDNKYKVVMSFTTLSARVTAEVPVHFLHLI